MLLQNWQSIIERAWEDRSLTKDPTVHQTIHAVIDGLDKGLVKIGCVNTEGTWEINEAAKKSIILYFAIQPMVQLAMGPMSFYDKIPIKGNFEALGVRVVPPAVARYGSYLAPGVVLMACYVNIGAAIGENSMIDIGAAIGSCAQIGKNIHISAGAVIGGVLEPPQDAPVIIEDGAFIGAQCTIVEGVRVEKGAVLGAHVTLTRSTKIFDVSTKGSPKEYRGYVPARSIVIAGTYTKNFPAGVYGAPCALIIGERTSQTDAKVALNEALRVFN